MIEATKSISSASVGILTFFRFLRTENEQIFNRLIVVGIFSGLAQSLVVGVVVWISGQRGLEKGVQFQNVILYGLALFAAYKLRRFTLYKTTEIVENTMHNIRLRIITKIRQSSLAEFELLGNSTLYTALTTNAQTISQASSQIVGAASSGIMVVFAGFIVAFISLKAFAVIYGGIAVGGFLMMRGQKQLQIEYNNAVEKERRFFGGLNDLLKGFKELKINDRKCEDFFERVLEKEIRETRDLKAHTGKAFASILVFANTYFFVILGCVLFVLPIIDSKMDTLVPSLLAVTIFTMGPVLELIGSSSLVGQANAAMDYIKLVESNLDAALENTETAQSDSKAVEIHEFESLEMSNVAFTYSKTGDYPPFHFGPANFELRKGEIVFVVGGNGSGKTTFLKLLTGLYYPESGAVVLDGTRVTDGSVSSYRSLFSPIFSDFHLFTDLYGLGEIDEKEVDEHLKLTEMQGITSITDGRITNLSLSTGQRKRVGLVCALLEKKPILVFDELAADQDPDFREHLYEKVLPDLAKKGVTVIAASHDERYFSRADRVVKVENGTIVELPDKKYR